MNFSGGNHLYAVRGGESFNGAVWAVGESVVLRKDPGSASFQPVSSPGTGPYTDVQPFGNGEGVLLAHPETGIWQYASPGWVKILSCACIDISSETASGFPIYATGSNGLFRSDGSGFYGVSGPFDLGASPASWYSSETDVWVLSETLATPGSPNRGIWHADGTAWTVLNPFQANWPLLDVDGSGPDNVYVVGSGDLIVHWNGSVLTQLPDLTGPFDSFSLTAVWVAPSREVFIAGTNQFGGLVLKGTPIYGLSAAPSGLTASPSSSQIDLAWTDNANNEANFEVERRTQAGGVFGAWTEIGTPAANATSHADTTASPGVPAEYRVRSCNYAGCSAWSNVVAVGPPAAPSDFSGSYAAGVVTLNWTDNSTNETGFQITRRVDPGTGVFSAWNIIATPTANATSYADASVTVGYRYQYMVRACDGSCSAWTSTDFIGAASPPTAPSAFTGSYAAGSVSLAWTDNASNETGFQITRRVDPGTGTFSAWSIITTPAANVTSYSDTDVSVGYRYQYMIRACNPACSPWTSTNYIPAAAPPTAPSDFSGSYAAGVITLNWTDNSTNETGFQITRRVDPGTGVFSAWNIIATPTANATSYADASVTVGYRYQYMVRACDGSCSAWTSTDFIGAASPPTAPSAFTGSYAAGSVSLAWTDNASNETGFQITRRVDPGTGTFSAWSITTTPAANVTSYSDTDVSVGYRYQYMIRACNPACSPWTSTNYISVGAASAGPRVTAPQGASSWGQSSRWSVPHPG